MKYAEPGFEIMLAGNRLSFSGKLEKSNYTEIDAFLRKIDQELSTQMCVIDLIKLSFLNSSGIRSLATFMLGSPKMFELHINKSVTWQQESIPALTYIKPEGIMIVA